MKSLKKNVISLILLLLVLTTSPHSVFASSESASEPKIITTIGTTITPYGNITGYKYKILNGRQWKRLWSYTYNKWMDPAWTLA